MGFPLLYIILVATSFNIPISGCARLLLSPMYYLVTGVAVLTGYGFWEMQRWSWYVFWAAQGLIAYGNAIIASEYAESHHRLFIFIVSLVMQGVLGLRVGREILVPYFFPRIRWWENNPRYKLSVPVSVRRQSGESTSAEVLDLSVVGCFLKSRVISTVGEKINLEFQMYGQTIQVSGTVVWDAMSTVTHPKGIGVIFDQTSRDQRKLLRAVYARMNRIASIYRKYRYWMEPIEFEKILSELESAPLERAKLSVLVRSKSGDPEISKRVGRGSQ